MEVIKEVINQSFGKLRIDPEQGRMGQNFEGVKNDLFVEREREREIAFTWSEKIRHPIYPSKLQRSGTLAFLNLIFNSGNPMQFLQRIFYFN